MAIRTTQFLRLGGQVGTGAAATAVYQVPAGYRAIVRSITVTLLSGAPARWTMTTRRPPGTAKRIVAEVNWASGEIGVRALRPWIVLEPLDEIQWGGTTASVVDIIQVDGVIFPL